MYNVHCTNWSRYQKDWCPDVMAALLGATVQPSSQQKHLECVSRSCLMGLATGSISFATLYLGQKYFTRQMKGMKTSNIIISSTLFSLLTSYLIVSAKLDECNKNFRKANTGRYGETWSDKIAKPENWKEEKLDIWGPCLFSRWCAARQLHII